VASGIGIVYGACSLYRWQLLLGDPIVVCQDKHCLRLAYLTWLISLYLLMVCVCVSVEGLLVNQCA